MECVSLCIGIFCLPKNFFFHGFMTSHLPNEEMFYLAQRCFPREPLRPHRSICANAGVGITNALIKCALLKIFTLHSRSWNFVLNLRTRVIQGFQSGHPNFYAQTTFT